MIFIATAFMILSLYFYFRLLSLKKGIKSLKKDFHEIKQNRQAERHIQIQIPDKDLENLAEELNDYIASFYYEVDIKNKDLSQLKNEITNLSHDLRTPLTSILGYIGLIKEEELSQDQKEIFEVVARKSYQLNDLVEQLYEYARLGNKDYAFHMEKLDFYRIAKEHLLDSYSEFETQKIELELEFLDITKPIYIMGDQIALIRILTNLTSNTLKYAKGYANIRFSCKEKGAEITYCTNRGDLSEYDIAHVFDRYYKKSEGDVAKKSSGLGLTITKLFTEQMGGSIRAYGDEKNLFIACYFPIVSTA